MSHTRIVEVCIFKLVERTPRYLLLKRADDEAVYPGIWQILSGVVNDDEHAVATVQRELSEETLLPLNALWVVPFVDTFYHAPSDEIYSCPVFAAQVPAEAEPELSAEHATYGWYQLNDAVQRLVWPGQRRVIELVDEYVTKRTETSRWLEIPNSPSIKKEPWL